jgi:hypothetical protein
VYSATEKVDAKEIGFQKIKQEIQEYHVILGHAGVLQLNNFLRFFMKYESKNTLNLTKSVVAECEICSRFNQGKQFVLKENLIIKQPMQAIAVDLGFLKPSIEGHTGFMIAIDITSRFVIAKPFFKKDEVPKLLIDIFIMEGTPKFKLL